MKAPLSDQERRAILERPRPGRALPILDGPPPADAPKRRYLPLAEPRDSDARFEPLIAVWEVTLRCDLACRHCGSRAGRARHDELSTEECVDLVRQLAGIGTRAGYSGGCGAGRVSIGIEADGTIKGCPSLATKSWSGGNVRETPLKDIWERSTALRYTRDRTVKDLWGYCATCYYADECKAGCTWTADVLFGRPGNNPYCHHRALELKRSGLRERVVRVEEAPGLPFDQGRFELVTEPLP